VAVNVSPVQFERPGFVESVLSMLDEFGLPPQWLELEITESIAMTDFDRTRERVDALRQVGISISIDDFGVGYSNLSQMARLNYDALKVDKSLVDCIGDHGKTESMVTAIITVSKILGHKIIAEGIESAQQMTYLHARGCHEFQASTSPGRWRPENWANGWTSARKTRCRICRARSRTGCNCGPKPAPCANIAAA
jgi:two-component system CheB/CheR fusion protein